MTKVDTEGRRRLADVVKQHGAREAARLAGVSESMVKHIAAGRRSPGESVQNRLRTAFQIPAASWCLPPVKASTSANVAPAKTARKRAHQSMRGIRELRDAIAAFDVQLEAAKKTSISPTAWASLLRGKADAAAKLAKLQGEGELTMATLVRSRIWSEVLATMRPVLARHPECAAELAEAFEALEQA